VMMLPLLSNAKYPAGVPGNAPVVVYW
jgi:hypothetical protein